MLLTVPAFFLMPGCAPSEDPEPVDAPARRESVSITGAAKDCFMGDPVSVGGVSLAAFDVTKARPIIAQLHAMDRFTGFADGDSMAVPRFDAMEMQLRKLVTGIPALTRSVSAADGSFTLAVTPVDSLLIVGYADLEDEPYFYAYKILRAQAPAHTVLDMSRGNCGVPAESDMKQPQE